MSLREVTAFGVGCFQFEWRRPPPFRFVHVEYASKIRGALEAISNVNNVILGPFDPDEADSQLAFDVGPAGLPSLEDREGFLPHPVGFEIQFDLYVPFRLQKELVSGRAAGEIRTEHFRVMLRYSYHGPVTFVRLMGDGDRTDPSTAVVIVREFLRSALNKEGSEIFLESLGPSPFHADFFLVQSDLAEEQDEEDAPVFRVGYRKTRAYDHVTFSYAAAAFADTDEAFEELSYQLTDELALFYDIQLHSSRSLRAWDEIQASVAPLLHEEPAVSRIARWRARVSAGKHLRNLHANLIRFEVAEVFRKHEISRDFAAQYGTDEVTYLRPALEASVATQDVYPIDQIGRLIAFMEERRSKSIELSMLVLASLIGGVVGAVLTAAL